MKFDLNTFLKISWLEGLSFLLLLLVAMPLKYIADMPLAVSVIGMLHGALFVAYCGYALFLKETLKWKTSLFAFVLLMAIVPFGMIILDRKLKS